MDDPNFRLLVKVGQRTVEKLISTALPTVAAFQICFNNFCLWPLAILCLKDSVIEPLVNFSELSMLETYSPMYFKKQSLKENRAFICFLYAGVILI